MGKCLCCKINENKYSRGYCDSCYVDFDTNKRKFCNNCQTIKSFSEFSRDKTKIHGMSSDCRQCKINYKNTLAGFMNEILQDCVKCSKNKARILIGELNITAEFLIEQFQLQKGKCFYSGLSMIHKPHSDFKCSVERLDNTKNYTKDNIKLVIQELNTMVQWSVNKIHYFRNYDQFEVHTRINEIFDREMKFKPDIIDKTRCRECDKHLDIKRKIDGFCKSCYNNSSIERVLRVILYNCRNNTKQRNKKPNRLSTECLITIDDLWYQLQKQFGKCYYSGINMTMDDNTDWRISIERLDVRCGYNKDNIVFVCNEFNTMDHSIRKKDNPDLVGGAGWSLEKINKLRMID